MASSDETRAEASSERAYASAAESLPAPRDAGVAPADAAALPARLRRARRSTAPVPGPAEPAQTAADAAPVKPEPAQPDAAGSDVAGPETAGTDTAAGASTTSEPARPHRSARLAIAKVKPVPPRPVAATFPVSSAGKRAPGAPPRSAPPALSAPIPSASTANIAKAATKIASSLTSDVNPLLSTLTIKDTIMDMTSNYAAGFKDAVDGAQVKAKDAFEKGTSMLGEANDFARANVEACVESGKILAAGLQDLGSTLVAEGRSAFEAMTADLKELAAAKSPAEFIKLQSEMMRKNFDGAVASGSKSSEAVMKLASDVIAPISGRVSVAVDKARIDA